jgi:catechol 2,3-dioxygenase-like lactoylglutathione lyase family enzyme
VDRALAFYRERLGWRLDADFSSDAKFRVVQLTPPGSLASVIFGTGLTDADPGSSQGLHLVVEDVQAARDELAGQGVEVNQIAKTETYTRAYAASNGFLTLLSDGERLTGAYALGPEAGEWLQQATLAIRARVPLDILRDTIQPFPTFSEIFVGAPAALRTEIKR